MLPHDTLLLIVGLPGRQRAKLYASSGTADRPFPDEYDVPPAIIADRQWDAEIIDDLSAHPIWRHEEGAKRGYRSCIEMANTTADTFTRRLHIASIVILVVDIAYIGWSGMAAALPQGLLGPGGKAILPAAFDGFTGGSWSELLRTSPLIAKYVLLIYRMYGIYCAVFGVMASAGHGGRCSSATRWRSCRR